MPEVRHGSLRILEPLGRARVRSNVIPEERSIRTAASVRRRYVTSPRSTWQCKNEARGRDASTGDESTTPNEVRRAGSGARSSTQRDTHPQRNRARALPRWRSLPACPSPAAAAPHLEHRRPRHGSPAAGGAPLGGASGRRAALRADGGQLKGTRGRVQAGEMRL